MQKFLGTNLVEAEPMNLGNYYLRCGFSITTSDDPLQEGYCIIYHTGYSSWSPKESFEKAYKLTDGLSFGLAIEALKKGLKVARSGWNGNKMKVMLNGKTIEDVIEPAMYLFLIGENGLKSENTTSYWTYINGINYNMPFPSFIAMKTADGCIIVPWLASQTDMLSDDWSIVE